MWNVVSLNIRLKRQAKPQGTPLDMQVKDSEESECHAVMAWIRVESIINSTLSDSKESRLSDGVQMRENLKNLFNGESK